MGTTAFGGELIYRNNQFDRWTDKIVKYSKQSLRGLKSNELAESWLNDGELVSGFRNAEESGESVFNKRWQLSRYDLIKKSDPEALLLERFIGGDFLVSNLPLVEGFEEKSSVVFHPSMQLIASYKRALVRSNGGLIRSFIVGAKIPASVAKDQIRTALIGALEAFLFELNDRVGRTRKLVESDEEKLKQLIADRLGNLPHDEAIGVAHKVLLELYQFTSEIKFVVNGGAISVDKHQGLVVFSSEKFGAGHLMQLHLRRQAAALNEVS